MKRLALCLLVACGGPAHETRESSAPTACPEGSHWDGTLCVRPPTTTTKPAPTHAAQEEPVAQGAWTPPALHQPPDTNAARAHFTQAVQLYSNGDPKGALDEFEAAYSYQPADALLYNIALALEQLGRSDEAIDVYTRYLATSLGRSRAAQVQQRINALKKHGP